MKHLTTAGIVLIFSLTAFPGAAQEAQLNAGMATSSTHGEAPTQSAAEAAGLSFLARTLRDPESARITWGTLTPNDFQRTMFSKKVYGYSLAAEVNAKNAYGAYTGVQSYFFFFRQGVLVYASKLDSNGMEQPLIDYRPKR